MLFRALLPSVFTLLLTLEVSAESSALPGTEAVGVETGDEGRIRAVRPRA